MRHTLKYPPTPLSAKGLERLRRCTSDGFVVISRESVYPTAWNRYEEQELMSQCKKNGLSFVQLLIPLVNQSDNATHQSVIVVLNHPTSKLEEVCEPHKLKDFALSMCREYCMDCIYMKEKDFDGIYLNSDGKQVEDNRFDGCLAFINGGDTSVYSIPVPDYPTRVRRGGFGEIFLDI